MNTLIRPLLWLTFPVLTSLNTLCAQRPADPGSPPPDDVVQLSVFSVSGTQDRGYRAANSVSATRINTPIGELPVTISAFTEDFIRDQLPTSLYDIARWAPGVTSNAASFTSGNNRTTVRGFGQVPLRNGFAFAGNGFADAFNIARVEVVKGPSSLLYGQISPGGLVNYITRRPTAKFAASITQQIASYDTYRTEVDVGGPLGETLGFRFSGLFQEAGSVTPIGDERRWGVAPVLVWKPFEGVELTLEYEGVRFDENSPATPPINGPLANGAIGSGPFVSLPRDFSYASRSDFRDTFSQNLAADLTVRRDGWNFRVGQIFSDRMTRQFATGQANGRVTPTGGIPNQITGPGPFQWRRVRIESAWTDADQTLAELYREFEVHGVTLKALVGWQHGGETLRSGQRQASTAQTMPDWDLSRPETWNRDNLVTSPDELALVNSLASTKNTYDGLYGLLNISAFSGRLNALGGVRRSTADGVTRNLLTDSVSGTYTAEETSPQAGALFKITRELSAFVSYSESFVPQSGNRIVNDVPVGPLPAVVGKGTDFGVKTELWDGRLSATAAYFTIENSGAFQQLFTPDPITGQNKFTSFPAGVQQSRGFEMDATIAVTPNWQIYTAYSHVDAKISENIANPALVGSPLAAVARDQFNLWTKYVFTAGPLKGWSVGGGPRYTSRKLARSENLDLYLPANTIFDAMISYQTKLGGRPVLFALNLKNIADKDYQISTFVKGEPRLIQFSTRLSF